MFSNPPARVVDPEKPDSSSLPSTYGGRSAVWLCFCLLFSLSMLAATAEGLTSGRPQLVFCCADSNDLFRVMTAAGAAYPRFDSPEEAIEEAPPKAGVFLLADSYPDRATRVTPATLRRAAKKRLRLYIEYPASLPGIDIGSPERVDLERAVIASYVFGESLKPGRILAIHDCHYVKTRAEKAHIVLAKVAGLDTAVYGIEDVQTHPLLFEHSKDVLVSTTKLSQFVTARYAPKGAIQSVWQMVLAWLQPGAALPVFDWTPTVRPSFARDEELPSGAARTAIIRGIDWHTNAKMLLHESWKDKYHEFRKNGTVSPSNPFGPRPDPGWPAGDGEYGVLEGVNSRVRYDGEQPIRWWLRTDSNGESSLAFALRSELDGDERSRRIAANLLDWVYFNSGLFQNDPEKANYGLVHWAWDSSSLYGDNDIRIILGCIGTSAVLKTDRWNEALVKNILGNYRTTGRLGFRGGSLRNDELLEKGWLHFWKTPTRHFAPHYQAWIWASYLWLYDKTGYEPLLERTQSAIRTMIAAYPEGWKWTNGIQQERARMLLTLAWLIRVDDQPEHRAWLKLMANDMQKCQDACGGIREELGNLDMGSYRPPRSNAEYGTSEASLIQANGDPVADLLYTCNFTFLGLHEAYAATGDEQYREMADRLAKFLVRVQVRSEDHPELDGGWFRAFDFNQWEYWGSNADHGWGAWSIEVGWTQAWIPTVLTMRELNANLWDMSQDSTVAEHWQKTREQMLPDSAFEEPEPSTSRHGALHKTVALETAADHRYPGTGPASLTDGYVGPSDHTAHEWLGFHGGSLDATIDLGKPTKISTIAATFLQSTAVGIFLPSNIEFAVSSDNVDFSVIKTIMTDMPTEESGPLRHNISATELEAQARFVRVRASNVGAVPQWHPAAGRKAWLFVDEIMINPDASK